jgi:hypothetical protein
MYGMMRKIAVNLWMTNGYWNPCAKPRVTQSLFRMKQGEKAWYGWHSTNRWIKYIPSIKEAVTTLPTTTPPLTTG